MPYETLEEEVDILREKAERLLNMATGGKANAGMLLDIASELAARADTIERRLRAFSTPARSCDLPAGPAYNGRMADKPTPACKPEDDTYTDEEAARRADATIRAMIGMKPKPRRASERMPQGRKKRVAERSSDS